LAVNYVFHVLWRYTIGGKTLEQFPTQSADVIATGITQPGDGTLRPDPNSIITVIGNNFPTPAGATVVLLGVSSAQCAAVYS